MALTKEQRSVVIEMQDQLLDLVQQRREARLEGAEQRVAELGAEIHQVIARCDNIRRAADD